LVKIGIWRYLFAENYTSARDASTLSTQFWGRSSEKYQKPGRQGGLDRYRILLQGPQLARRQPERL